MLVCLLKMPKSILLVTEYNGALEPEHCLALFMTTNLETSRFMLNFLAHSTARYIVMGTVVVSYNQIHVCTR